MDEDWGKQLSKIISAAEARVANYKRLVQQAYKDGDRELIDLFKAFQKDEERYLKRRRLEKRLWNEDVWGWYFSEVKKLRAEEEREDRRLRAEKEREERVARHGKGTTDTG